MIREERLDRIVEYLHNRHYASVDELIELLGSSKATVRRDLNSLSDSNIISLTRGGAISCNFDESKELLYKQKKVSNVVEKRRLGEMASTLIKPGMAVILDAGTTTRSIVPYLKNIENINLVTNDLMIASDVTTYKSVNTTVTGGQLRKDYFTLLGYVAEDFIRHMHADIGFIGFDAIDVSSGCFITNTDEVAIKRCIIEASKKVVALCDYTKFSKNAFFPVCPLSSINIILTNKELDESVVEMLKRMDIEVILA